MIAVLAVLVAVVIVVIVKETLFRLVFKEGSELESSVVQSDAWHHRSDAITSLAAGLGISVALIGGKGYEQADDWAAIIAALVIAWNGWRLLRPALNELMDKSPGTETVPGDAKEWNPAQAWDSPTWKRTKRRMVISSPSALATPPICSLTEISEFFFTKP